MILRRDAFSVADRISPCHIGRESQVGNLVTADSLTASPPDGYHRQSKEVVTRQPAGRSAMSFIS